MNKNHRYIHYKNKKIYVIRDTAKIQINNEWVDAIIYSEENKDELYVRTLEDFSRKFILI